MEPHQLKNWREKLDLTQQKAAAELGISLSTYAQYESGVRRDDGSPSLIPVAIEKACGTIGKRHIVKDKIREKITANGSGGITGPVLQEILLEIVDAM